jgi:hypothetical protein
MSGNALALSLIIQLNGKVSLREKLGALNRKQADFSTIFQTFSEEQDG